MFYKDPPRRKRWLERVFPWYEAKSEPLGYVDRSGVEIGSPLDVDEDTISIRITHDGRFTIDD